MGRTGDRGTVWDRGVLMIWGIMSACAIVASWELACVYSLEAGIGPRPVQICKTTSNQQTEGRL